MMLGRALGWALLILAVVMLGYDAWLWAAGGPVRLTAAGELWARLDLASLNLVQAVTERYIAPALWDPVLLTVLLWPAALVLGGLGLILVLLFRRRGRSRRGYR